MRDILHRDFRYFWIIIGVISSRFAIVDSITGNPCLVNNGGCGKHDCYLTGPGQRQCQCLHGYTLNLHMQCVLEDPCTVVNGGCEFICKKTGLSTRKCLCEEGYAFDDSGLKCVVNDPCMLDNGGCEFRCRRTGIGERLCQCLHGFQYNEVHKECEKRPFPVLILLSLIFVGLLFTVPCLRHVCIRMKKPKRKIKEPENVEHATENKVDESDVKSDNAKSDNGVQRENTKDIINAGSSVDAKPIDKNLKENVTTVKNIPATKGNANAELTTPKENATTVKNIPATKGNVTAELKNPKEEVKDVKNIAATKGNVIPELKNSKEEVKDVNNSLTTKDNDIDEFAKRNEPTGNKDDASSQGEKRKL